MGQNLYVPRPLFGEDGEPSITINHISQKEKEPSMDIAGLMALMQGNKGMDLPGILAEEMNGAIDYMALAKQYPKEEQRYEAIAGQEFTHMLTAVKDLFEGVREKCPEAMVNDLRQFIRDMQAL